MVQFSTLTGVLADVALPNSGFSVPPTTRVAMVEVGNPKPDAYQLRARDAVTVRQGAEIVWKGELSIDPTGDVHQWRQRGVDPKVWQKLFDDGCACEIKLAVPVNIMRYGPPTEVPDDADVEKVRAALALHARIAAGQLRPGEIPAHLAGVDPVVALFLLEQVSLHSPKARVPLRAMPPALAEAMQVVRSGELRDVPRWIVAAKQDEVYQWLETTYDGAQFQGRLEAGIRILISKIDG